MTNQQRRYLALLEEWLDDETTVTPSDDVATRLDASWSVLTADEKKEVEDHVRMVMRVLPRKKALAN